MSDQGEHWVRSLAFTVACSAWLPTEVAERNWFGAVLCALLLIAGVAGLWQTRGRS